MAAACCLWSPIARTDRVGREGDVISPLKLKSFESNFFAPKFSVSTTRFGLRGNSGCSDGRWIIRGSLNDEKPKNSAKVSRSGVGFGSPESLPKKKDLGASKPGDESVKRLPTPEKPLLSTVPQTEDSIQDIDTLAIRSLTFLFGLILVQGIILAVSGFLPDEVDAFIVDYLYPSFTPVVGLFIALAASYGLYKFLDPK